MGQDAMGQDKENGREADAADAAGGVEGGMDSGSAGGPGQGSVEQGNSLQDASDETSKEIEKRREGGGNAGVGDIG